MHRTVSRYAPAGALFSACCALLLSVGCAVGGGAARDTQPAREIGQTQDDGFFTVHFSDKNNQSATGANATWDILNGFSRKHLQQLVKSDKLQPNKIAWVELALIARNYQQGIAAQERQLKIWLKKWNNHLAAKYMPAELKTLSKLSREQAKQIAILLPLSGPQAEVGQYILKGIVAAHYASARHEAKSRAAQLKAECEKQKPHEAYVQSLCNFKVKLAARPKLVIYDTMHIDSMAKLFKRLTEEERDTDIVIGPLRKSKLIELCNLPKLPIPTLALNDSPACAKKKQQENLFHLSLNVEDELNQIVEHLRTQGVLRVMAVLYGHNWTNSALNYFQQAWATAGGDKVLVARSQNKHEVSDIIKNTLILGASTARAKLLSKRLGVDLAFLPRRRQDFQAVLLLANPEQSRFIKPLVDFHYANDAPIYSVSRIYSGLPNKALNEDLNGIQFPEAPWLIDYFPLRKQLIKDKLPTHGYLTRMLGLGLDALWLAQRLNVYRENPKLLLYGTMGTLRLKENGRSQRRLAWAQIQNGLIKFKLDKNPRQRVEQSPAKPATTTSRRQLNQHGRPLSRDIDIIRPTEAGFTNEQDDYGVELDDNTENSSGERVKEILEQVSEGNSGTDSYDITEETTEQAEFESDDTNDY